MNSEVTPLLDRFTAISIVTAVCLMQVYTQCPGPGEGSSCSRCLNDDIQPFCSNKPLCTFDVLILTGNLTPALAILTSEYTDCLTKKILISRQRYTGKIPEADFCALLSQRRARLKT